MASSKNLKARVIKALPGKVPLLKDEEVEILDLTWNSTFHWRIRIAANSGERIIRPFLLGKSRSIDTARITKLKSVELILEELGFWNNVWEPVKPRKAAAMKQMADCISTISAREPDNKPASLLHRAWERYSTDRKS